MRSPITCWQHTGCEADPRDQSSTERASEVTASTDRPTKRRPDSASGNHPLISSIPSQARKQGRQMTRFTVEATRRELAARFNAAGIGSAELDARLLVGHALGLDLTGMISAANRTLTPDESDRLALLANRRLAGEPVARI